MPKISIISAYFNRRNELWRTLQTISKSSFKDFEYIIVDDGSDYRQRIEDFVDEFKFIKLKRIEPKDKHWINPCIPFNIALSMAEGEIVILQSPECVHMGDILEFVANNTVDNQYLVFSCYSLSTKASHNLETKVNFNLSLQEIEEQTIEAIDGFTSNNCDTAGRYDSWFAHPQHRYCIYNFLTSMTKKDMDDLGGFDERFADGHAFDDTDLAARIEKKKMNIKLIEKPFCLHQYHHSVLQDIPNFREKELKNRRLYEELLKSPHYKVNNSFVK